MTAPGAPDEPADSPGLDLLALFLAERAQLYWLAWRNLDGGPAVAPEDVLQEMYLRVARRWEQTQPDPGHAAGYLRSATINGAREATRRRYRADRFDAAHRLTVSAPSAEEQALARLLDAEVTAALRALPRRQREAVLLRHFRDLPLEEVAEVMGISVGAAKAYASRGLRALRDRLAPADGPAGARARAPDASRPEC